MKRPIGQAEAELEAAREAIARMQAARRFADFEREWRSFLNSVGKVWTKVERACQHVRDQFQPWQGQYIAHRRDDPLLRYLHHARNVDQHTVEEVVELQPASTSISGVGNGPVYIKNMVIRGGEITELESPTPLVIKQTPPRVVLLPVVDSGVRYEPPSEHLGQRISPDPLVVASAGLAFYEQFLHRAKERFLTSVRPN